MIDVHVPFQSPRRDAARPGRRHSASRTRRCRSSAGRRRRAVCRCARTRDLRPARRATCPSTPSQTVTFEPLPVSSMSFAVPSSSCRGGRTACSRATYGAKCVQPFVHVRAVDLRRAAAFGVDPIDVRVAVERVVDEQVGLPAERERRDVRPALPPRSLSDRGRALGLRVDAIERHLAGRRLVPEQVLRPPLSVNGTSCVHCWSQSPLQTRRHPCRRCSGGRPWPARCSACRAAGSGSRSG